MNIQPVNQNQNRQQNFGMNFKVIAFEAEKAAAEIQAKATLNAINLHVSPKLRGEITLAMRDAGDVTAYMHKSSHPNSFLLCTSAKLDERGSILTTIENPLLMADFNKSVRAEQQGVCLLNFLKAFRPLPETAKTEAAFANEINFVG